MIAMKKELFKTPTSIKSQKSYTNFIFCHHLITFKFQRTNIIKSLIAWKVNIKKEKNKTYIHISKAFHQKTKPDNTNEWEWKISRIDMYERYGAKVRIFIFFTVQTITAKAYNVHKRKSLFSISFKILLFTVCFCRQICNFDLYYCVLNY